MTRRALKSRSSGLPLTVAAGTLAALGAGLAWLAYMRHRIWHDVALTAAVAGELRTLSTAAGEVAYYAAPARGGAPLMLIHSVNAAASSAEMKPLFDRFAGARPLASIDLPGFGFSQRSRRRYHPDLYSEAICAVAKDAFAGAPVDVVALSLGAEFAALAARQRPELFRSLVLIAPTGLGAPVGMASQSAIDRLRDSALGQPVFDTLVSRPSLRFFLQEAQRRGFDDELFHYAYATSHQPEAANAPFDFIAGRLFTRDIVDVYASLQIPVLALLAGRSTPAPSALSRLSSRPNWQFIDWSDRCGSLAHVDDPDGVAQMIETFHAARSRSH